MGYDPIVLRRVVPAIGLLVLSAGGCFDEPAASVGTQTDGSSSGDDHGSTTSGSEGNPGSDTTVVADGSGSSGAPPGDSSDDGPPPPGVVHHRLDVQVEGLALDRPLDDVPILVRLDPDRIDYAAAGPEGASLRFLGQNGQTLPYEIEGWNAGGVSDVWVRVPQIDPAGAAIFLLYGDPNAPLPPGPAEVWSNGFVAVWHLPSLLDSSTHGNDLGNGAEVTGQSEVAGMVGDALHFAEDAESQVALDAPVLGLTNAGTIEAWVFPDTVAPLTPEMQHRDVLRKGPAYRLSASHHTSGTPMFLLTVGSGQPRAAVGLDPLPIEWSFLAGRFSGNGDAEVFVDAVVVGNSTALGGAIVDPVSGGVEIGGNAYIGAVDEVRISAVLRSEAWLRVQDASARDVLIDYGPATPGPPPG